MRVSKLLSRKYKGLSIDVFIDLLKFHAELHIPILLQEKVCNDQDDEKFIACALGASCSIIVSGDKDLLDVSGFCGIEILKPSSFVKKYL